MSRYDLTGDGLAELVSGEPAYRVRQLLHGLYEAKLEPEEMTDLPGGLRARLERDARFRRALSPLAVTETDDGATTKWLYGLVDGGQIETVLMHYSRRSTVCISSQAGCAMACSFCATGQAGFQRHCSTGEIVEQVVYAARAAAEAGRRLRNVVFMGMGEPLANYDRVLTAAHRLNADLGIAARHLTISTVGIVPGIRRLAAEPLQLNLAVSLHAANDELRHSLVPISRRYRLAELQAACQEYVAATGRRLSLEWALIAGVNDSRRASEELACFAKPLRAHVNLIPLNPTPGFSTRGSDQETVAAFAGWLGQQGIRATVRVNRGSGIAAACGQLAATHAQN
jgi:23S rRNA (adenine2503-C2)-methyltransferase